MWNSATCQKKFEGKPTWSIWLDDSMNSMTVCHMLYAICHVDLFDLWPKRKLNIFSNLVSSTSNSCKQIQCHTAAIFFDIWCTKFLHSNGDGWCSSGQVMHRKASEWQERPQSWDSHHRTWPIENIKIGSHVDIMIIELPSPRHCQWKGKIHHFNQPNSIF